MRWGNNLKLVERTNQRAVVIEPAHYAAGFFFWLMGASGVVATLRDPPRLQLILLVFAAWLLGLGLYCCVDSTFVADHFEASLRVRRALWGLEWEHRYPFSEIEAVIIRKTVMHGSGLALRLTSGKSKSLTLSLHFQLLEMEQAALGHAVRAGRARAPTTLEHDRLRP